MADSFDKLKQLNLSRDEVNRIGEALKKPEFRKLLTDYVEELQDPKNKKLYEEEVTQLEKERGVDVTFIHPNPGYVIKTSVDGNQKAFINICVNDKINKPHSVPSVKEGTRGLTWNLPHSLSPPRIDLDNKGIHCQVFDIVFHPDTLHLAKNNKSFRNLVNETSFEAVERNFDVNLDKKNIKFPKLAYKGTPRACVIRKSSGTKPVHTAEEGEMYSKLFAQIDDTRNSTSRKQKTTIRKNNVEEDSKYTTPKYVIKYRSSVDLQEFVEHKNAKLNTTIPKELIVEINLPLLKSSTDMKLDVTEKTVQLISENPAKYKLNLTLPYSVNEMCGNAKFEKDLKKLLITLPVKKQLSIPDLFDSGVDSDHMSPGSPQSEEERTYDKKPLVNIIHSESQTNNDEIKKTCSETSVTNSDHFRTEFLDKNIHYSLPEFSCHVFENNIAFTLNIKNVDEKSVEKLFNDAGTSVHIKFTSIGSSFYPSHFTFYVHFPQHIINKDETTIEVWDNNVILQVPVLNCDTPITSYKVGIDEKNLSEKFVDEPEIVNKNLEKCIEVVDDTQNVTKIKNKVSAEEKKDEFHDITENVSLSSSVASTSANSTSISSNSVKEHHSSAIDIMGTSYESSGDELSCSSFSPRKCKSILKRYSRSVGRSISESSLDDYAVTSSIENYYASFDSVIPEDREQDEEASHSLKKTVRFSDIIGRQLFRSNSSILGQKKKNQRKSLKKKRALERRHTQSEASEGDERKERDLNDFRKCNLDESQMKEKKKEDDMFHIEIDN